MSASDAASSSPGRYTQDGWAPRLSRSALLQALDLRRPELQNVRKALDLGQEDAAAAALAEHFRRRTTPVLGRTWASADGVPSNQDDPVVAAALQGRYTVIGIEHQFDGGLPDFTFNPTTVPGTSHPRNHEWLWQFGRFYWWPSLCAAYQATGDERYAQRFVIELRRWLQQSPVPNEVQNRPGSRWRTIECGIRLANAWPLAFNTFRTSPSAPDDTLLEFVASWVEHAVYLLANPTHNNWLTMEANGLCHAGILFPEFQEAAIWRETALAWLRRELDAQVYPDGAQVELATGYHTVSLRNFVAPLRLARANEVPLPGGYLEGLERQYDYLLKIRDPLGTTPDLNDGGRVDVDAYCRQALEFFPHRQDFRWCATGGQEGAPPAYTSIALPWAGQYVLRSGWDRQASYLLFDAGPFGAGHQHEDKLSFVVTAAGHDLVVDTGNYPYEDSPYRRYALSSAAHSVVLVDGQGQNRRQLPRETFIATEPLHGNWRVEGAAAWVSGVYDDGFGRDGDVRVRHERAIHFDGDHTWTVQDTLTPEDGAEHTYQALFHLDPDDVQASDDGRSVIARHPDGAGLLIRAVPADSGGASGAVAQAAADLQLIRGQEEPFVLGWTRSRGDWAGGAGGRRPLWVAVFTFTGAGPLRWCFVLQPFAAGQAPILPA